MSKKHKRQRTRSTFPWIILIGGVLLVIAVLLFARQDGDTGGTPSISADPAQIDFGYQKLNTNLTFSIKVTNTGDGVLKFGEAPYIEILEGC